MKGPSAYVKGVSAGPSLGRAQGAPSAGPGPGQVRWRSSGHGLGRALETIPVQYSILKKCRLGAA